MQWLELSVQADQEAVESVSELFAAVGYNGGIAVEQPFTGSLDGPEYVIDPAKPVTVRTYIVLDEHAEGIRARIEQGLWALGMLRQIGPLNARPLAEEDWANAWKAYYPIRRVGKHWVIVPSWLEYSPAPDDLVLLLDPGMAFGTGLHPTTQLCLGLLEYYVKPNTQALDLGCGSGILAIAAARLGARGRAPDPAPTAATPPREKGEPNEGGAQVPVAGGGRGRGAAVGPWL